MKLNRAMSIIYFDNRWMGVQERSMLGRLLTARRIIIDNFDPEGIN
jgi:hypothetical protein